MDTTHRPRNLSDQLDQAAVATLVTVHQAMKLHRLGFRAAVAFVAEHTGETAAQVEALATRAAMVAGAR